MKTFFSILRNSHEKNWPEVHAAFTGSLSQFIYARKPRAIGTAIPVFCYHLLDKAQFEDDLAFLTHNEYHTIDAQTLVDHMKCDQPAPPRSVVLSIDDGARNLFEVGFPLLKKYSMKAVAFIVPRYHLEDTGEISINKQRPCTWKELKIMHESGHVDIQSHTYEHRYVPRWPEPIPMTSADPAMIKMLRGPDRSIRDDFRLAKDAIEKRIGKTVHHLAFVKYQGSDEAIEIGLECGYKSFWWGYLPHHFGNCPGQSPTRIARLDAMYLRRLPGKGRRPLAEILAERFSSSAARYYQA